MLTLLWACAALLATVPVLDTESQGDPRQIEAGFEIPDEGYCDQPYVVTTQDGNWLCVLTTGAQHEGSLGQHVVATISKDEGRTWSPLIDIEPADGPEASWVVPLIVPSGRVYAIYTFNGDEVRSLPGQTQQIRSDTHGWYAFRFSDDHGRTWSKQRYRIPIRVTAADRGNDWEGEVQQFWGIDKPKVGEDGVTIAFTKLGRYFLQNGEGWMVFSDNILTEADPGKIRWETLPEGEHGLRRPEFGSVQEEHNHVYVGPRQIYLVYRNQTGYPCQTLSADGGRHWTEPVHMTYAPGGRRIKTPRACPKLFRCENGKYLFWFHNHSGTGFQGRNPVWLSGGLFRRGKMHWSEPEILLYHDDPTVRMSYPDLIERDGRYWITETQKSIARVHEVDPTLLQGMWNQLEGQAQVAQEGLVINLRGDDLRASHVSLPRLPNLSEDGGFSIDLRIRLGDQISEQILLDSRDDRGRGLAVGIDFEGALWVSFSDGAATGSWACDPGLLLPGGRHQVTAIVDGGPDIVSFVVDGQLCDGGESRQYGWGRFDPSLGAVDGARQAALAPSFEGEFQYLRIYDRFLRTSEAVANQRASAR